MNYIYDIALNFSDCENYYDFFEWDLKDKISYIDEIPIFKISSNKMCDIMNYKIKISNDMLKKIYNKTKMEDRLIEYCCLVTDSFKVLALMFDGNGFILKISSLLLDEEDEVISNSINITMCNFKMEKLDKYNNNYLLTRREKKIQKELLLRLDVLYRDKCYDEIDYLYREFFDDILDINSEYELLINSISNSFDDKYEKLYDLIRLAE